MSDWISVKDRLPEKYERVIVVNSCGYVSDGCLYNGNNFVLRGTFGDTINFITHWMPLPEPPKE